jgi:transcriptional regulator with XRE-family HTH domain/uncharacterized cupin superfamily protein
MPVFSSHLLDYKGLGVFARVREERQRKGCTLREVAARIGVSPAQLSKIETGKTPLDCSQLAALAAALEVPVASLFPRPCEFQHLIFRRPQMAQAPPTARELVGPEPGPERHHNPVWPLADAFVGKHIEPVIAIIRPLADNDLHFIAHDHEEFMFVLEGEVESLVKTNHGIVHERLAAGDCMYFRSDLPHCHRSATAEAARTLNVMYSLRGAIDSEDGEVGPPGHQFYRRGVHTDVAKEAAEKIALLRRSRGLTLADLALSVNVPARQLRQIEQGKRAADLDLLLRVARKFRRPIEYFLSSTIEGRPSHFVQRGHELKSAPIRRRKLTGDGMGESTGNTFRPLAVGFPDRGMHPYYIQVKADETDSLTFHEHPGQEFIYVLGGEIELVTYAGEREVTERLGAGDCLFLESSVPHVLRGRSQNPYADSLAEILDIFWCPLGETFLFAS